MKKYQNACDILPKSLVEEIHKYFNGGLLWIPVTLDSNDERDDLIVQLAEHGEPIKSIAKLVDRTPRWVREIVRLRKAEIGAEVKLIKLP